MSKELVKTAEAGAVAVIPERKGFERMETSTVTMPTAKVLQPISKECADESFRDYNFRAGDIIHSLLLEKMPEAFIPLLIWDDKITFVPKQDAAKTALKAAVKAKFNIDLTDEDLKMAWVCRSYDNHTGDRFGDCATCGLCEFNGAEAPMCTKNVNVLSLFDEQELPVVVRFANTSHKHGRKFKDLVYYAGGNLFDRQYKLSSTKKTEGSNTWYEATVKPAGKVTDEDKHGMAEALHDRFLQMTIEVTDGADPAEAVPQQTREF